MTAFLYTHILPAAYAMLPAKMSTKDASALLMAIALQESQCRYRKQVGGPARGFWQFEAGGGVKGVLTHKATKAYAESALVFLCYPTTSTPTAVHALLEHNDVLAAVFARLLLWTLPFPLPQRDDTEDSWMQYIEAWRPGKPHRQTWDANFTRAWAIVE